MQEAGNDKGSKQMFCLLPTAYCLPPTAYCLLPTALLPYCLLPYCLLPTAYCFYAAFCNSPNPEFSA
jgi:hypothetical protein